MSIAISTILFAGLVSGQPSAPTISKDATPLLAAEWRNPASVHYCLEALELFSRPGIDDPGRLSRRATEILTLFSALDTHGIYREAARLKKLDVLLATAARFKIPKEDQTNTESLFAYANIVLTDLYGFNRTVLDRDVNQEYLRNNSERALWGLLRDLQYRTDSQVLSIRSHLSKIPKTAVTNAAEAIRNIPQPQQVAVLNQAGAASAWVAATQFVATREAEVRTAANRLRRAVEKREKESAQAALAAANANLERARRDADLAEIRSRQAGQDLIVAQNALAANYNNVPLIALNSLGIDALVSPQEPANLRVNLMELLRICYEQDPNRLLKIVKDFYN